MFRFAQVPAALADMSEQLQGLGGGDAEVARLASVCLLRGPAADDGGDELRPLAWRDEEAGEVLVVMDPRVPPDAPAAEAVERFGFDRVLGPDWSAHEVLEGRSLCEIVVMSRGC